MSGYFTYPFLKCYSDWLGTDRLGESGSYEILHQCIKSGTYPVITNADDLLSLLLKMKTDNPAQYEYLISLSQASKIQGISAKTGIPENVTRITMPKSILNQVGSALGTSAETICHDRVGDRSKKEELSVACGRPVFIEQDIISSDIKFLFTEKSIPLNKDVQFNWSFFIRPYVLPFKKIRIFDPYLYSHIEDIDILKIIKKLAGLSKRNPMQVQIISDLAAEQKFKPDVLAVKVKEIFRSVSNENISLELYTQSGSASDLFHKRLIWTDFWVIYTDRGFDFLKMDAGRGIVKRENTLYMTGKYASKNSIWHQIQNNWEVYKEKLEQFG